MRAPFITFEGGDGVGKSTQVKALASHLQEYGVPVLTTREPGGSPAGDKLRTLLVTGDVGAWTPRAEALLMYAARSENLTHTINPARARGEIVLCDRFADSTMAYQGVAGALGPEFVSSLYDLIVGDDGPDLTIVLDLGEAGALERAKQRNAKKRDATLQKEERLEGRFEEKGLAYQKAVRAAFLQLADEEPARICVIDASGSAAVVAERVRMAVMPLIEIWTAQTNSGDSQDG
ncbi:MAG: dTMP kinase [Pseudomonadota bacterium]